MERDALIELLKNHWDRIQSQKTFDARARFEALYDCFEVLGALETGATGSAILDKLKESDNEIKTAFSRISLSTTQFPDLFLKHIEKLKSLSPIGNNRTGAKVAFTRGNFIELIDVLRVVRNNVRHGMKEYSDRTDEIVGTLSAILYRLLHAATQKYIKGSNRKSSGGGDLNFASFKFIYPISIVLAFIIVTSNGGQISLGIGVGILIYALWLCAPILGDSYYSNQWAFLGAYAFWVVLQYFIYHYGIGPAFLSGIPQH